LGKQCDNDEKPLADYFQYIYEVSVFFLAHAQIKRFNTENILDSRPLSAAVVLVLLNLVARAVSDSDHESFFDEFSDTEFFDPVIKFKLLDTFLIAKGGL